MILKFLIQHLPSNSEEIGEVMETYNELGFAGAIG
jgi:hypothetical protein